MLYLRRRLLRIEICSTVYTSCATFSLGPRNWKKRGHTSWTGHIAYHPKTMYTSSVCIGHSVGPVDIYPPYLTHNLLPLTHLSRIISQFQQPQRFILGRSERQERRRRLGILKPSRQLSTRVRRCVTRWTRWHWRLHDFHAGWGKRVWRRRLYF